MEKKVIPMNPLAYISGDDLVRNLLTLLVIVICCALIYGAGRWCLMKLAKPLALTVWDGFFLLVGLIVALNFLLGLVGHPLIVW